MKPTATIKLGKASVRATYKRLNAVTQPGAKVGHHDVVEYATPADVALRELETALKKGKVKVKS